MSADPRAVAEAAARAGGAVLLRHFREPGLQVGYKDARANGLIHDELITALKGLSRP